MRKERWQRMTELFQQALERPRDERDGFLREACGEDLRLLRAVESLLEADSENGDFLESPLSRSRLARPRKGHREDPRNR